MKHTLTYAIGISALLSTTSMAFAECGIEKGSVRILSNDFLALQLVNTAASTCASGTVEVTVNQTEEHKNIQVAALTTNPAAYTVAVVANGSLVPLLTHDMLAVVDTCYQ